MGEHAEVDYRVLWTSSLDDTFRNDFIYCENVVFNGNMSQDLFEKKYIKNIYGPSVLVVAYLKGQPVGADALWRNDINGEKAYQSADTCVLPAARGKGIFMGMVFHKLEKVEGQGTVYGFPNVNSSHGFLKSGWHLVDERYTTVLLSASSMSQIDPIQIDCDYAKWWLKDNCDFYSLKKQGKCWLVAKRKIFLYSIVGELTNEAAQLFPSVKGFCILLYKSNNKSFYNKKRTPMRVITSPATEDVRIPTWKIDSI